MFNKNMKFLILSLILNISFGIIFPSPLSITKGWHPLMFEKDYINKPISIDFIDTKLVLWKGKDKYHVHKDVCPHQGALLSKGEIVENCIQCPYHGVLVGPYNEAHPVAKKSYGICKSHQGIIWWTKEDTENIPNCDALDIPNVARAQVELDIETSFSDCFKNSMDFHHAGWVHKNTFGNYLGEPDFVKEKWSRKGELVGSFVYNSNEVYERYTGAQTNNAHVFCKPSTTYNIVKGMGNFMVIHLAMRSITPDKTRWFLTSSSNYLPANLVGNFILEQMVRKVAFTEDKNQLDNMASDSLKSEESFKIDLALDGIYSEWNKVYDTPEKLEMEIIKENADINILCKKLMFYNTTIDFWDTMVNTTWDIVYAKHVKNGVKAVEIFGNGTATEITYLNDNDYIMVNGVLERLPNNNVLAKDLVGLKYSGLEKESIKLPFESHTFKNVYMSDGIYIRKGGSTDSWEVFKKSDYNTRFID